MTQAWLVLTRPDGRDVTAPSEAQLAAALSDVYSGKTASPEGGPGSAVLRFGYDDGLMYEMEVSSGGAVRFAEWSDRDCEIALASPRTMTVLKQADALQLWRLMAQRQVAKIRNQPWLDD
ncbi:hypothetical protein GJ698_21790 [Pseudoduganella sp. FT26W]|jgi:hypothetical protein|uniref:Uncharacterized protein n=1 Tax=Duganella aquatilis TaxID=2666082 RepID=A0A844D9C1_9BURK|nr:hypothetical protein [Duganella aquatilis]MRW86705.1 hypothetical protein [Duganella aquatilis]